VTARSRTALLALLALAAVLPFLPALQGGFLEWDDAALLAENPHWRGFTLANIRWMLTTVFGGPYQPLSWLSYALDFTLWGADPAAMRMTNHLLHGSSAVVFFLIVEDLIRKASPSTSSRDGAVAAAFAALFWAVHPLRAESVVWLTERRDVLSGLLYLLAVFFYLRDPAKPLRPLLAFCLAVLAKASVITLPLTLILLDRWPLRRRTWADKVPYLLIAAAAGVTGLAGQFDTGMLKGAEVGAGERLALGVHALGWYAAKTAWPSGLSPYHRVPPGFGLGSPAVWAAAFAALALAGLAWAARKRSPAVPTALLQYALALAPMAGVVRFGHHLVAERYSYLPGLGLAALVGAGLWAARRRPALRAPATAAAAAVLLACAGMAARASVYWSSTEGLWRRALTVDPDAVMPRVNLASYYRRANLIDQALREERAAVALDPTLAVPLNNLGADALGRKDYAEAERLLRAAVAADPGVATAHFNLASALTGLGRRGEALKRLEQAARLDFSDYKILNNLGVALSGAGEHGRAEAALRRATELAPSWPIAFYNHGNALAALGRRREAADAYAAAVRLDPGFALARRRLEKIRR
jgi:Tfp pilus assembly protein PilF